jgi:hypothetical protein
MRRCQHCAEFSDRHRTLIRSCELQLVELLAILTRKAKAADITLAVMSPM